MEEKGTKGRTAINDWFILFIWKSVRSLDFGQSCAEFALACPKILKLRPEPRWFCLCMSEDPWTLDRAELNLPLLVRRSPNFGQSRADIAFTCPKIFKLRTEPCRFILCLSEDPKTSDRAAPNLL